MTRFAPYVFLRDLASRWDVLAFIVVIGLIAFLGETSRGLFAPLSQLELTPLSLDPRHLPGASGFCRIFLQAHAQNCTCFLKSKRLKNATAVWRPLYCVCKLLKRWLLRLDSNQQPSG